MKRRIIIWTAIGFAAIAGLLALSGVSFYVWSQSEAGRASLASRIAGLASVSGEREVTIGRLAGDLYRTIHVEDISVRDNAGVWLTIGSAEIRWRPWSLLQGRVTLDRLHGKDVILARAPATAGGRTDSGDMSRTVMRLRRYRLDDVAITDLTLGPAVFGEKAVLRIRGSGRYDIGKGAGTAELALRTDDLSRLAPILGHRVDGQADLNADITVQAHGAKVLAHVRGAARGLAVGQRLVDRLLTSTPRIDGRLAFAQGKLSISEATVTSDAAILRLDGAIQIDESTLAADYRLTVPDSVVLPVTDVVEIGCRCLAEGKLSGPLGDPGISGKITAVAMTAGGPPLQELSLVHQLRNLASGLEGALEAEARTRLGRFVARTDLRFAENRVRLSGLHVEGADAVLDGALEIPAGGGPVTGSLQARVPEMGPWLRIAGIEGSGKGEFRVAFRPDGKRQGAELVADVSDARIDEAGDRPAVEIDRLTAKAASRDLHAWKNITATVDVDRTAIGDARMRRISVRASGSLSRAAVTATADGDWGEPVSLRTKFIFTANERQNRIEVSSLEGRAFDENIGLGQPFRLTWTSDRIAADGLALSLGKARLAGSLRLAQEAIDGSLSIADAPLRLTERFWPTGLAGMLSGQATVRGTRRAPTGGFSAIVAGLRLPRQPAKLGLSLAITGDWRKGRLALDGRVSDPAAPPARLAAEFPLRFERGGWNLAVPPRAPISAKLSWQGDVAKVWQFVPLSEHQLSGPGTMDVRLGGTLSRPSLRGWLDVKKGRYESLQWGTVLTSLDLRIDFDDEKAELTRFAGRDGNGGKITAKGSMAFDAASGHPFDLRASFAKLAVLRRDDFEALASGTLRFKGTTRASVIEGALETDRAEVRVLERLPPDVVDLDVAEIDGLAGKKTGQRRKRTPPFDPALKMKIEMPRRVFIRGRGIDSEWKGRIVLGGSVYQPQLSGNMETVRGQISVLGKVYRFQTGTVRFPDRPGSAPVIDVTAIHEGRRLTAQAHAQGPVKSPTVTLTSTPPLPQDEIVSQILFDKGASKLSRVEAAQLAITLAQLSGKGGGAGNAMEFARKTLGVDVLRLEETRTVSGDRAAAVSAGKYLTEDVYVGVKQGATSESGAVGVEVEVTPNIVIESEVRRSGESDTSIKFKLDY